MTAFEILTTPLLTEKYYQQQTNWVLSATATADAHADRAALVARWEREAPLRARKAALLEELRARGVQKSVYNTSEWVRKEMTGRFKGRYVKCDLASACTEFNLQGI